MLPSFLGGTTSPTISVLVLQMRLTSSLAPRVGLWLRGSHPPGHCDWFRNEQVTQIGTEALKLGSRILGNCWERSLLFFFSWTWNWEEVDLELGTVLRHRPSRERSQHTGKQLLKRDGQLSIALFKYIDSAVPGIALHRTFHLNELINSLFCLLLFEFDFLLLQLRKYWRIWDS